MVHTQILVGPQNKVFGTGSQTDLTRGFIVSSVVQATILVTLSWDSPCCTHIRTKSFAPALPVLIFLLLTCQLAKTNIEGGGKADPTNVTGIVAFTTDETIKPLVKSVC